LRQRLVIRLADADGTGVRFSLRPHDAPARLELGAIRAVGPTGAVSPERREADAPMGDGRLIRTLTMSVTEARDHVARWESEAPGHEIAAPPGVFARERSVADRAQAGARRRQRLALAIAGDTATAAHWSVPEPPRPADERAWDRIVARVCAPPDPDGWSA
jgi:hypothetical protein